MLYAKGADKRHRHRPCITIGGNGAVASKPPAPISQVKRGGATMAKGQKRSNREAKKPKTAVKKPAAGTVASPYQLPVKPASAKPSSK